MSEKRGGNANHPKKYSSIKVDPIRDNKDIQAIKKMLRDNPRDSVFSRWGSTRISGQEIC